MFPDLDCLRYYAKRRSRRDVAEELGGSKMKEKAKKFKALKPIIKEAVNSVRHSLIAQTTEAINLFVVSDSTTPHGVYRLVINERGMQLDKVE